MTKEDILRQIYKKLNVENQFTKNGGIGFGLIDESADFNIILLDSIYKTISQVRLKTNETGIEYSFVMLGNVEKIDNDIYFCVSLIKTFYEGNINDGRAIVPHTLNDWLSKNINNYSFCILCHTHPQYEKTSLDKSNFDSIKNSSGDKLYLRDYGMNISNGDIIQLIGLKETQKKLNNMCYFLQGISLPNDELNILDINFDNDSDPKLCGVHNVYRIDNNNIIPVENMWNNNQDNKDLNK